MLSLDKRNNIEQEIRNKKVSNPVNRILETWNLELETP